MGLSVDEIVTGRKTFFILPDTSLMPETFLEDYFAQGYECYYVPFDKRIDIKKKVKVITSLFKELFDVNPSFSQIKGNNFNKRNYYNVFVENKLDVILKSLVYFDDNNKFLEIVPSYFLDGDDLKRSYLRGAFLAKGSINDPKTSRYHLEFLVDRESEANFIRDLLNYFDLNAKVI